MGVWKCEAAQEAAETLGARDNAFGLVAKGKKKRESATSRTPQNSSRPHAPRSLTF
jgi:hypothetical protein